jgi:hypothetical protein
MNVRGTKPTTLVFNAFAVKLKTFCYREQPLRTHMKLTKLLFTCLCFTGITPLALADSKIPMNVAIQQNGGQKVRGPATISVSGINPIKQNVAIGSTVTYPSGPSLAGLPFIPPIPSGAAQQQPGAGQPSSLTGPQKLSITAAVRGGGASPVSGKPTGDLFTAYIAELNTLETDRAELISQPHGYGCSITGDCGGCRTSNWR